ncbi:MAG: hypothetical protein IPK82_04090 [Polyangiaceae bacterium]|nr:hypothetical protein [Polyangiaceae bacterium]
MEAPAPRVFRVSAGYSVFATDLAFASGADAYVERRAATASLSYRISDSINIQLGAGATLGGRFVFRQDRYTFDPGWIASIAGSWRVFGRNRNDPFVIIGGAVAASGAPTVDYTGAKQDMFAFDFRLSGIAGKTFINVLSPYLVIRAFGGPVLWKYKGEDQFGGDKYHFQVGLGLLVNLPSHIDVFAEVVPVGERAAALGAGYSF